MAHHGLIVENDVDSQIVKHLFSLNYFIQNENKAKAKK